APRSVLLDLSALQPHRPRIFPYTTLFRSADAHDLIDYRVTNRLPTIYTSNVTIDELAEVYDRRLWDRVRDMCLVLEFSGESKRRSEEHTSELQSRENLVCRLLPEKQTTAA